MMPEPPPLEALVSRALDLARLGERSAWLQAEVAEEAARVHGVPAPKWATEVGCSASKVRQMVRSVRAFPAEDARVALLSWSHHAVCAQTEDPRGWLMRAEAGAWSVADLRQAIREARDGQALSDEQMRAAGERILQRLRKWAEGVPAAVRREVAASARDWAVGA